MKLAKKHVMTAEKAQSGVTDGFAFLDKLATITPEEHAHAQAMETKLVESYTI